MTEDAQRTPHGDAPDFSDGSGEFDGVWRFGFAASQAMAERVQQLYQELPTGTGGDVDADLRRLRIDLERAADVSLDAFDRVLALVRSLDTAEATRSGTEDEQLVVRAPAGGRGSAELWAHNVSDATQPSPELRCGPLTDFDGVHLPDSCLRFECAARPIEGRNSRRFDLIVDVPKDTPRGSYHGLLLTRGAPQVALRVRVEVT